MKVHHDSGEPIEAEFRVLQDERGISVIFESAGGTRGKPDARNVDYAPGLELILERLASLDGVLTDALLETAATRTLSEHDRRLELSELEYPLPLHVIPDLGDLRRRLSRAQAKTGRVGLSKKGGGNPRKRIRLRVQFPADVHIAVDTLSDYLAGTTSMLIDLPINVEDIEDGRLDDDFDPGNETDARRTIDRAIKLRQGQPEFRRRLLAAYENRCAITSCDAEPVLEAAHIRPFHGAHTNHIQNGLLLRADVHTLFDRGLVAVKTRDFTVLVAPPLRSTTYAALAGTPLRLPTRTEQHPSEEALEMHRRGCGF